MLTFSHLEPKQVSSGHMRRPTARPSYLGDSVHQGRPPSGTRNVLRWMNAELPFLTFTNTSSVASETPRQARS